MPRLRPPTSGYARIAQDEDVDGRLDDSEDDLTQARSHTLATSVPRYAAIQPPPSGPMHAPGSDSPELYRPGHNRRRGRSNSSGVDIKAINARLERWAEEIASKFKIARVRGKTDEEEQLEIHHSVFQPPDGIRPATAAMLEQDTAEERDDRMTKAGFEKVVESVRVAIEMGLHPSMISQGSSGSYFARNTEGTIVGVFKPKDEEPYASRNPKWTKWIHRNLFPCFFGRACLIPNLSYVSEAAAYVLDTRLRTNLVPYTDIVHLSSKSFFYDYWDRRNYYRRRKPFPAKVGSFQVFLKGFKDANLFLREHPWPDQTNSSYHAGAAPRKRRKAWKETCHPRPVPSDDEDEDHSGQPGPAFDEAQERRFFWTETLQQSLREELEKLVILDYIMRNTDRGLDNWMIRVDHLTQKVTVASRPPKLGDLMDDAPNARPIVENAGPTENVEATEAHPYRLQQPMNASSQPSTPNETQEATISIGAIDNSLSWPWKHPDAWRSFPFGWLFLPVSLIGQPFSDKTRKHFLPLLTSKHWWSETQSALRQVFSQDSDFKEKMFARQIAVMKGQAWNVVETLKTPDHGPLELTRRARVCVWDDLVDIPVAVPLRVPSAETRRRRDEELRRGIYEEEMDISAANSSAPQPQHDLLGLTASPADLPNANRFGLSRNSSSTDARLNRDSEDSMSRPTSPVTLNGSGPDHRPVADEQKAGRPTGAAALRPNAGRSKTRASLDLQAKRTPAMSGTRVRHNSFSIRRGSNALLYDGDDLEGDLGYAAAEGMEKNQRKVIVERLETVKSSNPVFTWC